MISTGYIVFKTILSDYSLSTTIPIFFSLEKNEVIKMISELETENQKIQIEYEVQSENIESYINKFRNEWRKFCQKEVVPLFKKGLPHPDKKDPSFEDIRELNRNIGIENRRFEHVEETKFLKEWMIGNPPSESFKYFIKTSNGFLAKVELDKISYSFTEMNHAMKSQVTLDQNI